MNKVEADALDILNAMDSPIVAKDAEVIQNRSQSELLRNSTFDFLQKQMKDIDNYKIVIHNALASLNERIAKNEIDAKDTLSIINSLTAQVTAKTQVILEPFKAAPQSSSPLLAPPKDTDDTSFQRGISEMSSQDLQLLDSFIRKVASIKSGF